MVKSLSKWHLLSIGIGAVIGWSWVIYAGYWSVTPGTLGGILAFGVAALLCSLVGLVYAELTSAFPKIGVDVSITFIGLGQLPSIIVSWCVLYLWMSFILVEAIMFPIILGNLGIEIPVFGEMFSVMGTPVMLSNVLVAVIFNTFFAFINYRGVKLSGSVQTAAVAILTLAAVFFCGSGIAMGDSSNAQPLFTDAAGLTTIMLMVPGFLSGFNAIPQAVEETSVKPKTVGRMVLLTVSGSALFDILIITGLAFAMPEAERAGEGLVVVQAVSQLFGGSKIATGFITFASLLGMLTTWNAAYIAGSRFMYGLARAKLLPESLAVIHPKYGTPKNAIILMFVVGNAGSFRRHYRDNLCGAHEYRFFRPCHHLAFRFSDLYQTKKDDAGNRKAISGTMRKGHRLDFRSILHRVSLSLHTMGSFRTETDRMGRSSSYRGHRRNRLFHV